MFTNGLSRAVSRVLVGIACLGITAAAFGQEEQADKRSPKVDELLKQMGAAMKAMSVFSFTAEISSDAITPDGEKIESHRQNTFVVQQPRGLQGEAKGGPDMDRTFLYNGKQLIILDHVAKVYSATDVPDNIDAMLDFMYEKYGISVPTADFLYSDVYDVLTSDIQSSRYVGAALVNGQKCHQLAVRLSTVDYQIWIADGAKPLPVRMVLTYKEDPASPQFRIDFSDWKTLEASQAPEFKLDVPATYSKVDLEVNLAKGAASEDKPEEKAQE